MVLVEKEPGLHTFRLRIALLQSVLLHSVHNSNVKEVQSNKEMICWNKMYKCDKLNEIIIYLLYK